MKLPLSGDPAADQLLEDDPLALLIGMLLDQQIPMEKAFHSPLELKERLGGRLDAAEIGAMMGWNPKRVYNELYQARCTLIEWQAQIDEEGTE